MFGTNRPNFSPGPMQNSPRHDQEPASGPPANRGAPHGHRRFSPAPDPPRRARRELDVHEECAGPLAGLLWRALSDVALWSHAAPEERSAVFQAETRGGELLAQAPDDVPELAKPLRALRFLSVAPGLVDAAAVADACGEVAAWAEAREMKRVALQFAEAAARVEPDSSTRSYVAGRLCRRAGEFGTAGTWFRRAIRLARLAKNEVDFANAHRGYGFVWMDMGRFDDAEPHFWKCVRSALRVGRKSLAGSGYHDLFVVAVHREQWEEALLHGQQAVALYKRGHPRFPNLAHDVAFFWCRRGYFSSALPVLKIVASLLERDRGYVLASLARAAAAVRDHILFERTAHELLARASSESEMAASSLYHLAEGARCFHEWERSEQLARSALELARTRQNGTVVDLAEKLLEELAHRKPGDVDIVPEEGSVIDETRDLMLRKLRKQSAPGLSPGAVPPERYTPD